jgi:signal peptidase I
VKRTRFRSALLTGVFVAALAVGWWFLAPTRVGGSTTYVVTHGISMEPRFHTGDLALVRPAGQYKVGDIVAYHSVLLNEVVLHRIVAIHDGHYTFKGDNNNFLDPIKPPRSEIVGKLWLHIPHGGFVLNALHDPVFDVIVCGLLGVFLLGGFADKRRRGRRQRKDAPGPGRVGPRIMKPQRETNAGHAVNFGTLLTASGIAVAVFLVLAVVAFTRPAHKATSVDTPYTQSVSFGYSARVSPGPVYPTGKIKTNDPIFLSLVHQLDVHIGYSFSSAASSSIAGTEEVLLNLSGPGGWARHFVLTPPTHFTGDQTGTDVTLSLRQLQNLMARIASLTGNGAFAEVTATVEPVLHVSGKLGGRAVSAAYQPGLGFQFEGPLLQPSPPGTGNTTAASSGQAPKYTQSQDSAVSTPATGPANLSVFGVSPQIPLLRWIGLLGLLGSAVATAVLYLRKRAEPFQETAHIQSQYGHMIVPIVAGEDLGWPAVDVPTIKALAKLAESGQRLILHSRSGEIDTYMVNDEGTVYRYQVRPSKVVWGEWSDTTTPVKAAA